MLLKLVIDVTQIILAKITLATALLSIGYVFIRINTHVIQK